eukprot:scaffold44307_cov69-Phaeocystis_antarctica.AAC.7
MKTSLINLSHQAKTLHAAPAPPAAARPRTPRVEMMAQLCGGLRAKNENAASDNSPRTLFLGRPHVCGRRAPRARDSRQ